MRCELAATYRLVALHGWTYLISNHLSARVPGTDDEFLLDPYGLMFEEVTASSLVQVDQDGNVLSDTGYIINPAGFVIHSCIHAARHDVDCVMHLHTRDGTAWRRRVSCKSRPNLAGVGSIPVGSIPCTNRWWTVPSRPGGSSIRRAACLRRERERKTLVPKLDREDPDYKR